MPLDQHQAWFANAMADPDIACFICYRAIKKIGIVRFDRVESAVWQVSINLNPVCRGLGYGAKVLQAGLDHFRALHQEKLMVTAEVRDKNIASQHIFQRCGFALVSDEYEFLRYTRDL